MTDRIRNVLFLCTGNSARSILAEAVLSRLGHGRFRAWSAGSQPKGAVHPMALQVLASHGHAVTGFRSKSWSEFSQPGAPQFDMIVTVCDNAAGESCPVWIGRPMTAHWGIADPAAVTGEGERAAFERALALLTMRIERLVALPLAELDEAGLRRELAQIGRMDGATAQAGAGA